MEKANQLFDQGFSYKEVLYNAAYIIKILHKLSMSKGKGLFVHYFKKSVACINKKYYASTKKIL